MRRFVRDNTAGFTLPELLVAVGFCVLLLGASSLLLIQNDYGPANRDAARRLVLAEIAQGLAAYRSEHHVFPPGIPEVPTMIGSTEGQYNLCPLLVPKYLKDLPLDPADGVKATKNSADEYIETTRSCNAKGVDYTVAATIQAKDGHVILAAPGAEATKPIQLTL